MITNFLQNTFLKKFSAAIAIKLLGAVASFVISLILSRKFGAETTGIYFFTLSLVTIFFNIGTLGLPKYVLRKTATAESENNRNLVSGTLVKALVAAGAATALLSSILYLLTPMLSFYFFQNQSLTQPLRIFLFSLVPLAVLAVIANFFLGVQKNLWGLILKDFAVPLVFLLGLLLVLLLSVKDTGWIFIFRSGAAVSVMLASFYLLYRHGYLREKFKYPPTMEIYKSAFPLLVIIILQMFLTKSGTIILAKFVNADEVGIFNVIIRIAMLNHFVLYAINNITARNFSVSWFAGDIAELKREYVRSIQLGIVLSIPFIIAFIFFPLNLLSLFGSEFSQKPYLLTIVGLAQAYSVSIGPVTNIMIMAGFEKKMRTVMLYLTLTAVLIFYFAVLYFGLTGAIVATAISLLLNNSIVFFLVKKYIFSTSSVQ